MADRVPSGREVLARASTPTGDWQLQWRAGHYEMICSGVFLMASHNGASERRLAEETLAQVRGEALRVLVGGLGIGYTVQAVLDDPRVVRCDVVEIEPLIVAWHRRYFASLCGQRPVLAFAAGERVALSCGVNGAVPGRTHAARAAGSVDAGGDGGGQPPIWIIARACGYICSARACPNGRRKAPARKISLT